MGQLPTEREPRTAIFRLLRMLGLLLALEFGVGMILDQIEARSKRKKGVGRMKRENEKSKVRKEGNVRRWGEMERGKGVKERGELAKVRKRVDLLARILTHGNHRGGTDRACYQ